MPSSVLKGSPQAWIELYPLHNEKCRRYQMKRTIEVVGAALGVLVIVLLVFGGRISYVVAECPKGVGPCMTAVAVALGIVDVYDKNGRCIGAGCNM